MKLIKIGIVLCGMFYGFMSGVSAQTNDIQNETPQGADSLVNVAYRTVSKKDVLGPISTIRPTEYLDKNYSTYAFYGLSAFVGGSNLWNLGASLVLIDGVARDITDINTAEVDQISFLKGSNAIALYGSRGANGVILVTTKRGKAGEFKKSIRVNTGINTPISYPNYLGTDEYMKYYNQALKNDGLPSLYTDADFKRYETNTNKYLSPDVDYYSSDYLRKYSNYYDVNTEFSGGTDKARFYTNIGAAKTNSLLNFGEGKNEGTSRLNIRGNVDLKLNDYISTFVNISTVFYDSRTANGNYWGQAANLQPNRYTPLIPMSLISTDIANNQKLITDSHNVIGGNFLGGSQQYLTNPIADVYAAGYNTYTNRRFQYTSGVDVDLKNAVKGLSLHGLVSVDYSNSYNDAVNKQYAVFSPTWNATSDSISSVTKLNQYVNNGTQSISGQSTKQVIDFNMHLDYVNTFNQNHNVSAMLVAAGAMGRQTGDYQYSTNSNLGLQFAYNFSHRYYAELSSAIVNSTKLPENNRVAFSPTLSLAWLVSSESFMKGISAINNLKVSASAGVINTDLDVADYFLYNSKYSSSAGYSWYDGTYSNSATSSSRSENKDLSYSKRKEYNFTIDADLFQNKVSVQANIFSVEKNNIPGFNYNQYPSYFNTYNSTLVPYSNFAADQYNGFDLRVDYKEKIGDVNLIVGATGTYVNTKALKRDDLIGTEGYRQRAGKPTDAIFGLQADGFFSDQADIDKHATQKFGTVKPGDIKYKDQNGDGVIDEKDEVMIGRWNSPFTCGLHFSAQWKDFTLFVLGTGSFGGTGVKNGNYYWVYGANAKYSEVVRNSWTEATKATATYPRLTTQGGDNNFRYSDFWTYSTDQINISRVQLTYTLPESVLSKTPIKGVNIYVSGSNLLMLAKNKDIMQLNVGTTPQTRFYNFGIKADF